MADGTRMMFLALALAAPAVASGGDWPLWRYDAQRSAAAPDELPAAAWPALGSPVAPPAAGLARPAQDAVRRGLRAGRRRAGGCSSARRTMTASPPTTPRPAREIWRFFADGPVRFAPLAWEDRLYFVSDDGYLYCLRSGRRHAALEVPRRPGRPQNPRQRAARSRPGRLAAARSSPTARSTSPPASGRSWASSCTPSTPRPAACSGPTTATARSTSSSRTTPTRSPASRRKGRWSPSASGCSFPAAARCPPATTAAPASCCYYQLAENGKRGGGSARRGRRSDSSSTAARRSTCRPSSTSARSGTAVHVRRLATCTATKTATCERST